MWYVGSFSVCTRTNGREHDRKGLVEVRGSPSQLEDDSRNCEGQGTIGHTTGVVNDFNGLLGT